MIYFLDTSALQHRYIQSIYSRGVKKTVSDKRNKCFISSATVIEIASTFAKHCRKNGFTRSDYRRFDRQFWRDVRDGVLEIREPRQREYHKALHLLEFAGVDLKRNITSFDAVIAASCLELALETSRRIKFCTGDWTLYDITSQLSAYKSVIDFRFIGIPRV